MTSRPLVYDVPGISCDHCKNAIESAVAPLDGVEFVTVDVEAKTVEVCGGDPTAIEAGIAGAGYTVA